MDRLARLTLLLVAAALPLAAVAQTGVVELEPTRTISITCAVDGSSSATITTTGPNRVEYELVAAEDLVMCQGATCATGGIDRPKGNHGIVYVPGGRVYSCRSLSGTARLSFVPVVVHR